MPKLDLTTLRREHRLVVLQMPQAVVGRNKGLMEISEEAEEDADEDDLLISGSSVGGGDDEAASVASSGASVDPSTLSTEDPFRRFQVGAFRIEAAR